MARRAELWTSPGRSSRAIERRKLGGGLLWSRQSAELLRFGTHHLGWSVSHAPPNVRRLASGRALIEGAKPSIPPPPSLDHKAASLGLRSHAARLLCLDAPGDRGLAGVVARKARGVATRQTSLMFTGIAATVAPAGPPPIPSVSYKASMRRPNEPARNARKRWL
jgi:hypothetical protein